MTLFAGEVVRVTNQVKFEGRALTPVDGDTVKITIYDAALDAIIVPTSTMTWDDGSGNADGIARWYYDWNTANTSSPAGTYWAKCEIDSVGGQKSWEYIKVKLNKDKANV